jgi:hypothetical protein
VTGALSIPLRIASQKFVTVARKLNVGVNGSVEFEEAHGKRITLATIMIEWSFSGYLEKCDLANGERDTCSLQMANFERVLRDRRQNAFPNGRALLVAEKAVEVH